MGGRVGSRVEDHLGDPVAIPQIQKDQRAVVAAAVDPAGQRNILTGVRGAQLAAGVGAVHRDSSAIFRQPRHYT